MLQPFICQQKLLFKTLGVKNVIVFFQMYKGQLNDASGSTGVPHHGLIKVMGSTSIHEAQSVPKSPPIPNTVHPLGVRHSGGVST